MESQSSEHLQRARTEQQISSMMLNTKETNKFDMELSTHEEIRTISTQIKAQLEYKYRKTTKKFKIHKGKKYQTLIEDDSEDTDTFYEAMTEYNLQESPLLISKESIIKAQLAKKYSDQENKRRCRKNGVFEVPTERKRKHGISERDELERLSVHRILQEYLFNESVKEIFLS
uniref:Uncharacterized protein n=1 Tax=Clytia hemisphaerica TaxID=252671 RepID=A0A7M5WR98_9CNID|eukprot:TCONS_00054661-protein